MKEEKKRSKKPRFQKIIGMMEKIMNNDNWMMMIYENNKLWINDISEYPSVIAYEYQNLREMYQKQQAYGVLMCLKDNYETLLKLETLLSFSWAEQNTSADFRIQTISQLTTPNLTLGAWMELSRILLKNLQAESVSLPYELPLDQLCKKYRKLGIVNWRNQKIGHGAMELENDEEFQAELLKRTIDLRDILQLIDSHLKDQKLYANGICLEGPNRARKLDVSGQVMCLLAESKIQFCVDPYVLIRKHEKRGNGVYFFDNQKTKTLTVLQSYADGSRANEPVPHFEQLRKFLDQDTINSLAEPDDPYLDEAENRELDMIQMSHGFVEPEYLVLWLQDCIQKHDKGVFLLQMERGMGKSVFAEKLDRLYKNPIDIADDLDVRTYHYNRIQSSGTNDFTSRMEWEWANEYGKTASWQRIPRISDSVKVGKKPAEAICYFLETIQHYTERNRNYDRIMMVLDGLDEITENDLWEYIPSSDSLSENVYILLISRTVKEDACLSDLDDKLSKIKIFETLSVERTNQNNTTFLQAYMHDSGLHGFYHDDVELLISKSDYRVLYLGMLCRLIEYGMQINDLPNSDKLITCYLSVLDQCYGEYEGIRIREILAVLSTLGDMEPLTLSTIGALTAAGKTTLGLIGMMRDLSPMLKTVRGHDGNRYTIANPDLADALRRQLPEADDTIRGLIQLGEDQIWAGYPLEYTSAEPIIAHITELAILTPEKIKCLGINYFEKMSSFITSFSKQNKHHHERTRECDYYKQLVLFSKLIYGREDPLTLSSMHNLAISYYDLGKYTTAMSIDEQVLNTRIKVLGLDHPDTLSSMNNLARSYRLLGQYEKAIELDEQTLEYRKKVLGPRHLDTLGSMNNLAASFKLTGQYHKAELLESEALSIRMADYGNEHPGTLKCMNNLAVTKSALGNDYSAAAIYRDVLEISTQVLGADHPDTLKSMHNLAASYIALGQYEEAKCLYEKTADIQKTVLGENHPNTLKSKSGLALSYYKLKQYDKAENLYKYTLNRMTDVQGEEHPDTLNCMSSLSELYREKNQYEAAAELDESIFRLRKKNLGEKHPDTVKSICKLADDYLGMNKYQKAIDLQKTALQIRTEMYGKNHPDTLESMENLMNSLEKLRQYEMALYSPQLDKNTFSW